jgi:hypothetical protein
MHLEEVVSRCLQGFDEAADPEEKEAWIAFALEWLRLAATEGQFSEDHLH